MSYIIQLVTNTLQIHIAGLLECGSASDVSKELTVPLKQRPIYSLFYWDSLAMKRDRLSTEAILNYLHLCRRQEVIRSAE